MGVYAFLFTDLAGSSRLWEAHPAAMEIALTAHDAILRGAVEAHRGDLFATMGDGIAAAFATADDAIGAAVAAQAGLRAHPWSETGELRVRMGIHIGPAQRRGVDYFGPTLNRCARLMGVGYGGQVLLSGMARASVGHTSEFRDLGTHRLRDLAAPEQVFQLLTPGLEEKFPPLRTLDFRPGNLPFQTTTFVGRQDDVTAAIAAMDHGRIVTLTGVGGVGKTRLALQIAADVLPRFTDGAWVCELAPIGDPAAVAHAIASIFGVQPEGGRPVEDALVSRLSDRKLLLVLDNCEHVLDAVSELVELLVGACADIVVLATSREALAIAGEVIRPVGALDVDGAVQLFVDRATAVRPDFSLTPANESAVSEICRRLDGVPLIVELAAARVPSMSPAEIAQHLDERFRLLTGGRRTAVERHRTLRGVVDWSFELLDPVEQRVFSRLAVFAGGFVLEAAETVAADAGDAISVLDAVGSLVRKSMVVANVGEDVTRYSMLETLRQYAEEQLVALGEADTIRLRHADYFATFAEAGRDASHGSEEARWVPRLSAEVDNFRAAVTWAIDRREPTIAARLVAALGMFAIWQLWSEFDGWAAATAELLDDPPVPVVAPVAASVYAMAAEHAWKSGDVDRARDLLSKGLALPDVGDVALIELYTAESNASLALGDVAGALVAHDRCLEASDRVGMASYAARSHAHLAFTLAAAGQPVRARAAAETALAAARQAGSPTHIGYAAFSLGESYLDTDTELAVSNLQEAERCLVSVDNPFLLGVTRISLVSALGRSGDQRRAVAGYLDLLGQWQAAANRLQLRVTVRNAAELLARRDRLDVTVAVHGAMRKRGAEPPEGSPEATRLEASLVAARAALGDGFEAAVEAGALLSDDDMVALVRQALEELARE